jgi:2-polyprenyl-6-methoxyphenol hydroxylase-like FAD-dependent oxidoreductase
MVMRRVLVVGGGIGGLVLARALARLGVGVDVVERSPQLRAPGAGISLGANAMRALEAVGVGASVAARGQALGAAAITDARGRTLSAADIAAITEKYGSAYAFERGALHAALAEGLAALPGVAIRCGVSPTALREADDGVAVATSDGLERRYHAVVGADGLRSQVRRLWFGEQAPEYAGYTCWRWVGAVAGEPVATVEMWGRGLRVGLVPLAGGQVYAFFVANAPAGTPGDPSQGTAGHVRRRFAGFGGAAPRVLAALGDDGAALLHHDIEEIEVASWCRGRVALLGDAAHAMTPNFGQGAAMAIEDAVVLARELVAHDDAAAGLRAYEARRRPRVADIQRGARRLGKVAQWQSPVATWARDLAVRCMPAASARRALEAIVAHVP